MIALRGTGTSSRESPWIVTETVLYEMTLEGSGIYVLSLVYRDMFSLKFFERGDDFDRVGAGDKRGKSGQVEVKLFSISGTRVSNQPILHKLVNSLVVNAVLDGAVGHGCHGCFGAVPGDKRVIDGK